MTADPQPTAAQPPTSRGATSLAPTVVYAADQAVQPSEANTSCATRVAEERGLGTRLTVLHAHAQGGLGRVSVAHDEQLDRRVALKEIRPDQADDAENRWRFLTEAEITGQLEHPGIVPIYGLGRDDAGRPYYAMRFVQGKNLAEALAEYYSSPSSLAFLDLLRHFVVVCRTMAYAHDQGVIHRDLKPSNIMLGPYGEVLVVDWGLAKRLKGVLGSRERNVGDAAARERSAGAVQSGEEQLTQADQVLGTPAYMSPEQAAGRWDRVNQASDIYSLGAVLFCLLTGKPPCEGANPLDVIRKVQSGALRPPSQVRQGVPPPLEAVCLKAMAREPADRYATAAELARDVERWLADEPVEAWSEPFPSRAARWVRHHRLPVVAGAAAFVVSLALGLWRLERHRSAEMDGLRAAAVERRDEAVEQRGRAELLRAEADQQRRRAEALQYNGDMKVAALAWEEHDVPRMIELLDAHGTKRSYPYDFRNFEWYWLWRRAHPDAIAIEGHSHWVWRVAFSPDGSRVVSASSPHDPMVRVWDANSGRKLLEFEGTAPLAFSPDGQKIAAANRNGEHLSVRDAGTGRKLMTVEVGAPGLFPSQIDFSPDGVYFAASVTNRDAKRREVRVFHAATGEQAFAGGEFTEGVAFSPDGRWLAAGVVDLHARAGGLIVWNRATGEKAFSHTGYRGTVNALRFSSDGNRLLSGTSTQEVTLWKVPTGEALLQMPGREHERPQPSPVAFSSDLRLMASDGRGDRTIRIWDVESGEQTTILKGHTNTLFTLAFSADDKRLISGGADMTIRIWDLSHAGESKRLRGEFLLHDIEFAPHGDQLAAGTDRGVIVWSPESGQEMHRLPVENTGYVLDVDFNHDGSRIAAGTPGEVRVWSLPAGKLLFSLQGAAQGPVAFSPDGSFLATFAAGRALKIWNLATGQELMTLTGHDARASPSALEFSPDGKLLASSTLREAKVWDLESQQSIQTRPIDAGGPACDLAFSPNGRWIASAGLKAGHVAIWEPATGREVWTLKGHLGVSRVAFSPDGARLVSGGGDSTIRIWDLSTGREIFGFNASATKLALDRNARRLAFGAHRDGLVEILDLASERER